MFNGSCAILRALWLLGEPLFTGLIVLQKHIEPSERAMDGSTFPS
jgi:hypothetical protein